MAFGRFVNENRAYVYSAANIRSKKVPLGGVISFLGGNSTRQTCRVRYHIATSADDRHRQPTSADESDSGVPIDNAITNEEPSLITLSIYHCRYDYFATLTILLTVIRTDSNK